MNLKFRDVLLRYVLLLIFALPGLSLFYWIFSPLTLYPVFGLLDIFLDPVFCDSCGVNTILINQFRIEIIGACIAGSAYSFLLILNLSTPNIKLPKRLKILLISFISFLVLNILRIFFMSLMYINESPWFEFAHKFLWYVGTTIFVVLIWFILVKMFEIKEIPFYSDLKYLYSHTKRKKKGKKKSKK